jgi:antitoxin PrlF
MILAKITSKGQVTVPKAVRQKLQLQAGDTLAYEIEGDSVRIRKVKRFDLGWHQAVTSTLEEWATPEDDEAFGDL